MFKIYAPHISFLTLLLLLSCATKPQSDVDTPEYHFKAGMRAIDNEDYQQSITSFQRSVDLDSKFALGYGGLGLANAYLKNNKNAKDLHQNVLAGVAKIPMRFHSVLVFG